MFERAGSDPRPAGILSLSRISDGDYRDTDDDQQDRKPVEQRDHADEVGAVRADIVIRARVGQTLYPIANERICRSRGLASRP